MLLENKKGEVNIDMIAKNKLNEAYESLIK